MPFLGEVLAAASHHEDHSSGGSRIEEFAVLQILLIPQLCYAPFQLDFVDILLLSGFLAAGILGSSLGTCASSLCCIELLLSSEQCPHLCPACILSSVIYGDVVGD